MAIPTAKFSVTIGFNVGNETLPDCATLPLINSLRAKLACEFGGATIIPTLGAWIDNAGQFVSEPGILAYVLCADNTDANYALFKSIANEYRVLFNQESVIVSREPLEYEFISYSNYYNL